MSDESGEWSGKSECCPLTCVTWVRIYHQIASPLLEYENRQQELVAILRNIGDRGLPMDEVERAFLPESGPCQEYCWDGTPVGREHGCRIGMHCDAAHAAVREALCDLFWVRRVTGSRG